MKKISLSLIIALISTCIVSAQSNTFPGTGNVGIAIATGYTATHSLTFGSTATGIASYSVPDQTTNYRRMVQSWNGNIYQIGTYFGGSGSLPSIEIGLETIAGNTTLTPGRLFSINTGPSATSGIFDFNSSTTAVGSLITLNGNAQASASGGVQNWLAIQPTIDLGSSAGGYRALLISPYLLSVGAGTTNYLIDAGTSSAASGGGTYTSKFVVTGGGNVGIGTTSPASPLTIIGNGTGVSINPHGNPYYGTLAFNRDATTGAIFDATGNAFQINNGGTDYNLHFQVYNGSGGQITNNALVISGSDGSVGINTASTFGYRFAINGTAIATAMTVKPYSGWPDYVFKKQYRLPPLAEVKTYIDQNHHLPEIPTEPQVAKYGINLGDMDKLLVKKVEELTLYIIELNKQLKEQQKEIDELKAKQ